MGDVLKGFKLHNASILCSTKHQIQNLQKIEIMNETNEDRLPDLSFYLFTTDGLSLNHHKRIYLHTIPSN